MPFKRCCRSGNDGVLGDVISEQRCPSFCPVRRSCPLWSESTISGELLVPYILALGWTAYPVCSIRIGGNARTPWSPRLFSHGRVPMQSRRVSFTDKSALGACLAICSVSPSCNVVFLLYLAVLYRSMLRGSCTSNRIHRVRSTGQRESLSWRDCCGSTLY